MGIFTDFLSYIFSYDDSEYLDDREDYLILCPLAEGGFGSTSLVLKISSGELFASKRNKDDLQDFDLKSEYDKYKKVDHKNVVKAHRKFRNDDGGINILTEFHQGPSIKFLVDNRIRFTPEIVAEIGRQIANGLQAIHKVGLIHGDISPNNILISEGRPIIIDFGLSRKMISVATQSILGTPCFMAPETGFRKPNEQSDIFALGAVLYFLYFQEEIELEIQTGRSVGIGINFRKGETNEEEQLIDVLKKSLEINPRLRFKSAAQMSKALKPLALNRSKDWWKELFKILYISEDNICEECGKPLPHFARYCPWCGDGKYKPSIKPPDYDEVSCLMSYPCADCEEYNASFWKNCHSCSEEL